MYRELDERILTAVLPLDRKEVPKGTLKQILIELEITLDDFIVNI